MNSSKNTARLAGFLWLLTAATAGFSLVYVRSKLIVFGDATATAGNIIAFESLFRAAIASSLLSQIFVISFGLTIFRLFKGANKTLATLFLTSLLVSAGVGVVNSLNNIGALVVLTNPDYLKAFQPEQINVLAMIFLRLNNFGIGLMEIFAALYMVSFGLLIITVAYVNKSTDRVSQLLQTIDDGAIGRAEALEVSLCGARGTCLGSIRAYEMNEV
jgi:hypothetical protein